MPPKYFYKKRTSAPIKENRPITGTYLIIVESPSKCNKIMDYLGADYYCIASNGHIRYIESLKSIDTKETFIPRFSMIEEKEQHVEKMREIISKFSPENILLASDDDREGEAISWHICQVFQLPIATTKRILFHEITKPALLVAVQNPTKINMSLVNAQIARQVLDIIVGYKVSPFLWKYLYHSKTNSLSAGRCQTPALRLVYDNEKEKQAAQMEYKYKTTGKFTSENFSFILNHEFENPDEVAVFLEKSRDFPHILSLGSPRESRSQPPKPFNTSRLLQVASNMLHMSPKETMSLCQILYQNGFITYMRTDSTKYSPVFLEKMRTFITRHWKKPEYVGDFQVLQNTDDANPHEAIHVTNLDIAEIPPNENKRLMSLYRLIRVNSIESCMAESNANNIKVTITAPNDLLYHYTLEIPQFLGWRIVGDCHWGENAATQLMYLRTLNKPVAFSAIESVVTVHNRHSHYTEATLVNKLETMGIGRPSTFATIIETILERGYVKKMDLEGEKMVCSEFILTENQIKRSEKERTFGNERGKLVIQPLGILSLEFLVEHFDHLFAYDYTKSMEEQLDQISAGLNADWANICRVCDDQIRELAKSAKNLEKQVYPLDDKHDLLFEKYGPVIRFKRDDGTLEFLPVKKDMKIDLERLKRPGEYSVEELMDFKNANLGKYNGEDVILKTGKFGPYVQIGEETKSLKTIDKPLTEIVLSDVISILENPEKEEKNVLRILTPHLSVRKGKFGAYVFYKTPQMHRPQFLNIRKFPHGFITCEADVLVDWLTETYQI